MCVSAVVFCRMLLRAVYLQIFIDDFPGNQGQKISVACLVRRTNACLDFVPPFCVLAVPFLCPGRLMHVSWLLSASWQLHVLCREDTG
jgi:hypothetical protein